MESGPGAIAWLMSNNKAFVRRFITHSKSDPYIDKVELVNVNPTYAEVRYPNESKATVSTRQLSPCPNVYNEVINSDETLESNVTENDSNVAVYFFQNKIEPSDEKNSEENNIIPLEQNVRQSNRCNKRVHPVKYVIYY